MSTTDQIKPAFVLQGASPDVVTLDPNGNAVSAGLNLSGGGVVPAGLSAAQTAAVQQMITSGLAALQLGQIPGTLSANAIIDPTTGVSLTQDVANINAKLAGQSATAPVITAAPTITSSGAFAIAQTLTAHPGAVTEGAAGTHTNTWQWFGTNSLGVTAPLGAAFSTSSAATPTLPLVYPTHLGLSISISQTPVDTGVGLAVGNSKASLLTTAITNTPPTYSGGTLPVISPSGSQAPNVVLTCGTGTLSGGNSGASFTFQWQYKPSGGAFADIPLATANAFTTQNGQSGGQLQCLVTPTTAQGVGTAGTSSNAVTVTGAPALVSTVAPTFSAGLVQGVADPIVPGTYTGGSVDPTCVYLLYCQEAPTGLTTPMLTYGALPLAGASYTPPDNATFLALTGLASPVGKHFAVKERAFTGGIGPFDSLLSATVVCAAAPTALVLNVPNASYTFTMGVQFNAFTPVTVAQGNGGPYTFAYAGTSQNPPGFGTINAATGAIPQSTPTITGTVQQTYQVVILVTDTSNSTTATASFIVVVNPVPPVVVQDSDWLSYIHADQVVNGVAPAAWNSGGHQVQMLGGDTTLFDLFNSGNLGSISGTWVPGLGVTHSGNITNAPAGINQALRFGIIVDPLDATRHVFYGAALPSDPPTFAHLGRVEIVPGGGNGGSNVGALAKTVTEYATVTELNLSSTLDANGGDGESTNIQIHNTNPLSIAAGPYQFDGPENDIFPVRGVMVARIFQPLNNNGSSFGLTYPFTSDNPTWPAGAPTDGVAQNWPAFYPGGAPAHFPRDRNMQIISFYKGDPVASGSGTGLGTGVGYLKMYIRDKLSGTTTQIVNLTNLGIGTNDGPAGYPWDYIKVMLDMLHIAGPLWMTVRSVGLMVNSKQFTAAQIGAYADAH